MKRNDFKFQIPNGLNLQGRYWPAEKEVTATLVGIHGYSEYSLRYWPLVEFFTAQGFDIFWFDLPGHGESEGERSDIDRFSVYIESIEAFLKVIKPMRRTSDLKLFGHSLGGLICTRFLQASAMASEFSRVGLSSPLFGLSNYSKNALPFLKIITQLLPNFKMPGEGTLGADGLTHDKKIIQERLADPLIKPCVTINWVREFLKAREVAFREPEKIKVPTAFYLAGDDRVVSQSESSRFFDKLTCAKHLKTYEGWYHELSNEIEREIFFKDLLAWYQTK